MILACLLLPIAAWAQVSYTGTTAHKNFGLQAIGSTSNAATFSFSVSAGTTVDQFTDPRPVQIKETAST
jgi:hypothetical protein